MSPFPREVHRLILRACEYVTLHGQKDLAGGVKNLEMEMILNYLAKLSGKTLQVLCEISKSQNTT